MWFLLLLVLWLRMYQLLKPVKCQNNNSFELKEDMNDCLMKMVYVKESLKEKKMKSGWILLIEQGCGMSESTFQVFLQ